MTVNRSKRKDPRFWKMWRESGAIGTIVKPSEVSANISAMVARGDMQDLSDYVESLDRPLQAHAYYSLTDETAAGQALESELGTDYVLITAKALKAAAEEGHHLCDREFGRFARVIDRDQREDIALALIENVHDTFPFYTTIAANSWIKDDARVSESITSYYDSSDGNNERMNALLFFLADSRPWQAKQTVVDDLAQRYVHGEVELDNPMILLKLTYERIAADMDDAIAQTDIATKFFDRADSDEELAGMVFQTFEAYTGPFSAGFFAHWEGGLRDTKLERDKNSLLLPYIGNLIENTESELLLATASDFVFHSRRRYDDVARKLYGRLQDSSIGYATKLHMLRALTESGLPIGINSDKVLSLVSFTPDHIWIPGELRAGMDRYAPLQKLADN